MPNPEVNFWNCCANQLPEMGQFLVQRVSPADFCQFASGCQKIADMVGKIKPDVIFFPERGASPLCWGLEVFDQEDQPRFLKSFPPLGTHVDIEGGNTGGLTTPEKKQVVGWIVKTVCQVLGKIKNPLLIDESQQGNTIKQNAHLLYQSLRGIFPSIPLSVIIAQDNSLRYQRKNKPYSLSNNLWPGLRVRAVELPLFSIDRQPFLNYLLYPGGAPASCRAIAQMTAHNVDAEKLIKLLIACSHQPDLFEQIPEELPAAIPDFLSWLESYRQICATKKV